MTLWSEDKQEGYEVHGHNEVVNEEAAGRETALGDGSCGSKYLVRKGSDYLTPRSEGVVEGGGA